MVQQFLVSRFPSDKSVKTCLSLRPVLAGTVSNEQTIERDCVLDGPSEKGNCILGKIAWSTGPDGHTGWRAFEAAPDGNGGATLRLLEPGAKAMLGIPKIVVFDRQAARADFDRGFRS